VIESKKKKITHDIERNDDLFIGLILNWSGSGFWDLGSGPYL
jgi:hypothetical protein